MKRPQYQIEEQEYSITDSREEDGSDDGTELPLSSTEGLVQSTADVSRHNTQKHVKNEEGVDERSTSSRGSESNSRQDDGKQDGEAKLCSSPREHAKQHWMVIRRAEDISVNQFPAGLVHFFVFFFIRQSGEGIVSRNISLEIANENGYDQE